MSTYQVCDICGKKFVDDEPYFVLFKTPYFRSDAFNLCFGCYDRIATFVETMLDEDEEKNGNATE